MKLETRRMKAPRTLSRRPLALLRWFLTGGPTRFKAARLRRDGHPVAALCMLTGNPTAAIFCIRQYPTDLEARHRLHQHLCRYLCRPQTDS